jgi:hypothetical protein
VEQGQARKVICASAATTRMVAHEAAARAMTFRTAADTYLDQHEGGLSNPKHHQQWRNTLAM